MKLTDSDTHALGKIPLAAWANVLSLDAVFVAVAWQQLLMRVFCHRSTRWSEGVALSLAVWLIYVADRLLDGSKLQMDQPHTLRHRFYRRHHRVFVSLWIVGLVINTLLVVRLLPTELLRNGLLLASAVLVYGASVHFTSKRSPQQTLLGEDITSKSPHWTMVVPKEVRVGVLFALGVSLTTWTQLLTDLQNLPATVVAIKTAIWPLLVTTCALALIFSWNCILVARFEHEYDRAQRFPSIANRPGWINLALARYSCHTGVAGAVVVMTLLIFLLVRLPPPIEIASLASALGLMVSLVLPAGCAQRSSPAVLLRGTPTMFDIRGAWVDAVLWTPPLVLLCWM